MMAMFIAARLIEGRVKGFTYQNIFRFRMYQQYKEDVDAILIAEGREDLIA